MFNKSKQAGFTLLELLVVITLLALLSVGALVAYDGVGENAGATAAANNVTVVDRTIRQYQAVTGNFPNQWDVLSNETNAALPWDGISQADISNGVFEDDELIVSAATRATFGGWQVPNNAVGIAVQNALIEYGIDELQHVNLLAAGELPTGVLPNTAHNEGTNPEGGENDTALLAASGLTLSVLPAGTGCAAGGAPIVNNFNAEAIDPEVQVARINSINDFLEDRQCNLILALGFGGDAAKSMQNSSVQMTAAPTFSSRKINPARNYGRFVGLFHMGHSPEVAEAAPITGDLVEADIFSKPRLIAILTPEGQTLDEALAAATAAN